MSEISLPSDISSKKYEVVSTFSGKTTITSLRPRYKGVISLIFNSDKEIIISARKNSASGTKIFQTSGTKMQASIPSVGEEIYFVMEVNKSFDQTNPHGLAWDGSYLWVCRYADKICKLTTNGTVQKSFAAQGDYSTGLTWDGSYLWQSAMTVNYTDMIYKLTTNGTVQKSFSTPYTWTSDLAWDGTYLWGVERYSDIIYKMTTNGTVQKSFATPASTCLGLSWEGGDLWLSSDEKNKIYKLTTNGTVQNSFSSPYTAPTGVVMDNNNYLWHGDAAKDRIYKLPVEINLKYKYIIIY